MKPQFYSITKKGKHILYVVGSVAHSYDITHPQFKFIQSLMEYNEFRKFWPKIDLTDYHKKLYDYEYKRITGVYNGKKKVLKFHLLTAKVINDPRFQVTLYFPADKLAEEFCRKGTTI